jgi:type I restriction enzyme S subunit
MTKNSQLPEDWKWVKLGEVCSKMANGSNAKQSEDKIGYPISRIETIWNETIDLNRVKYIEENDEAFVAKYSLQKDDILFSHINSDIHLGKTAIFKNQTKTLIHGINLLLIRLSQDALPDFFNYQFKYKRSNGEFISIAQKSVNQSSINQPKLKNIDFVLPPKPTQRAIVSKIEELFSEIENGIKSLFTAQQQLETYRQSVLKWAFEGKLTNDNVKEGEILRDWRVMNLGQIFKVSSGKGLKVNSLKGGDYAVYGGNGVNGYHTEYFIENPKLIIGRVGVKCGVTHITKSKSWVTDNALIVDPIILDFDRKFFKLKLEYENLNKLSVSTAQPVISGSKIYAYEILLPPIKEQQDIVQEIESRLSVADKMEESINESLQQAEALKQSILKKAFEGRLI